MPEPKLTLAVEHYDRHLPLLDRTVTAEGIQLDVWHITVESGRHERMLDRMEWDCAELSMSSYIMAITRGAPLTAIPVFPRRLFSQSQMYVNTAAGINGPQDLIGKKVGLRSFQTTLSVLAKGDLQHEYGIPLDQVNWITSTNEPVSFQAPAGVSIERAPQGNNIETMLVQGEIDAYMVPRMPQPFVAGASEVGRLFQDSRSEEISYFHRNGFYPIMHLVAVKQEVADQHAGLVAPHRVGRGKPAAQVALVDHVVVQQGGGMDELDTSGQRHMAGSGIVAHVGRRQRQHRAQPFAAGGDDMPGQLRDQFDRTVHALDDQLIDRLEVFGDQLTEGVERRLAIPVTVQTDDNAQRESSEVA